LTDPLFIASAPFTFAFKFLMAYVCGKIAYGPGVGIPRRFLGAAAGALLYVALYLSKTFAENYIFYRLELETTLLTVLQKGIVSTVNGIIAVIAAVPLSLAIRKGLARANFEL